MQNKVFDKKFIRTVIFDRQTDIDIARALGIILVVLGHTRMLPSLVIKYIYGFHMPLFFTITGYLYYSPSSFSVAIKNIFLVI